MTDLTAIILTKDEEKNIAQCIKSIKNFAKRVTLLLKYYVKPAANKAAEINQL